MPATRRAWFKYVVLTPCPKYVSATLRGSANEVKSKYNARIRQIRGIPRRDLEIGRIFPQKRSVIIEVGDRTRVNILSDIIGECLGVQDGMGTVLVPVNLPYWG